MRIKGEEYKIIQLFCLIIYYGVLRYLPASTSRFLGKFSKKTRYICCRHIFKFCGINVNIEKGAVFGNGINLCIGDYSGLGKNCHVPNSTIIGKYVMMGPNCYILENNHSFKNIEEPMMFQGKTIRKKTIIEDDVWVGRDVIMTPGRLIKKGTIIGAGCVLVKDFPEYSIVGGNPSRFIKSRID